ncbi:MAG TPA: nucleotidyltransferase family protein [Candidatus Angelobacter sp.]
MKPGYPMKAFLLAAGEGTRLRPLTESVPKCLLPVQGVPLLEIWLETCEAAGITEVLVNVHAHAEQVKDFVRRQTSGVKVRIAEEPVLLGSAGTLKENKDFVAGEKAFFVLYGDVLTNVDLGELLRAHLKKSVVATIGIYQVPDPKRCGIVTADASDMVTSFVEKPARPETNWAFAGLMVASPGILEMVPDQRPADIGFDLLPKLVGSMAACKIEDYVLDLGTMNNYTTAQTSWPGLKQAQMNIEETRGRNAQGNHI